MRPRFLGRLMNSRPANIDPRADETAARVVRALEESVNLSEAAAQKALEAQQLFGSIRREIAVNKAKGADTQ